jgi:hypothetical protein
MPSSPIRDGFRATWRMPGLVPAEISWRWAVAGAFWALVLLSFVEYAASLPVSRLDWILWKIGYPPLAANAFTSTIAGSGYKMLRIAAVLVPGIAVIWTFAGALGRTATLQAITGRSVRFRTMLALSFLRAALALAAITSFAGVFELAMQSSKEAANGRAVWILIPGWILVAYSWAVANWFLSFAPVIAAEGGRGVLAAISDSGRVFGERLGSFLRVNGVFGALHLLTFLFLAAAGFLALVLVGPVAGKAVALIVIGLLYFGLVDFLFVARLAAYATLARDCLRP